MRKLLLFISLVLGSVPTFAQANFRPGYVVQLSGDTLRGEIQARNSKKAALECTFRANPDGTATTYKPGAVLAYGSTVRQYESHTLPDSAATPLFLEILERGPATLYLASQTDKADTYFLRLDSGRLRPLRSVTQIVRRGERQYNVRVTPFRDTLTAAFQGCEPVQKMLSGLNYTADDISRAVYTYNGCRQPNSGQVQKKSTNQLTLGVVVGTSLYNRLTTGDGNSSDFYDEVYESQRFYTIGLGMTFKPGRPESSFAIVSGLLYEPGRRYEEANRRYQDYKLYISSKLALDYLALPLLARYEFGKNKMRPYVEAGGFVRFVTNVKEDERSYQYYTAPVVVDRFLGAYRVISFAQVIGAGVSFGRSDARAFSVGIRADQGRGPFAIHSTLRTVSVLLSYQLTR